MVKKKMSVTGVASNLTNDRSIKKYLSSVFCLQMLVLRAVFVTFPCLKNPAGDRRSTRNALPVQSAVHLSVICTVLFSITGKTA